MLEVSPRTRTGYGVWWFSTSLGQLPPEEMMTAEQREQLEATAAASKDDSVWSAISSAFTAGAKIYEARTKEEIAEMQKKAQEAEARAKAEIERARADAARLAVEPAIPTAVWIGGGILAAGVLAAFLIK